MVKTTLTYGVFACVLVASVCSGYALYSLNRDRAVDQFQSQQLHTARVVAATLDSELGGLSRTLRAIADAAANNEDALGPLLERQMTCAVQPCFSAAAAYDASGRTRYAAGARVGLHEADLQSLVQWAREPAGPQGERVVISSSGTPSLVLLTPLRPALGSTHNRRAAGLLAGEVSFDSLFARQRGVEKPGGNAVLVLDEDGSVLFHSDHPEMRLNNVRRRSGACFQCHDTFGYLDRMLVGKTGVIGYDVRGVAHLAAFAPFDAAGRRGVAAVMGPADYAIGVVASTGRQLGWLMIVTIVTLSIAGGVTWIDRRRRLDAASTARLERANAELTSLNAKLESAAVEWRATVDTMDGALIVLEPYGRIERMNRPASALLPGEPFSWLGRPSESLAAHPPWDSALALARDAIEHDTILTSRVHREPTGRTWDLWCRTSQRTGRDAVVVVARDVTALVELQESLRRSETMAALGSIIAGVAHEVRNPLFAISSLVDAWSVQKNADGRRFHQALRNEVGRLKALMNDLLEYGTPAKSTIHPHGLSSILHEAVRACAPEAEARRVRLAVDPPAIDLVAWVDPNRFVRVLINLIQNAVQFSPADSTVTISNVTDSRDGASRLCLVVRDCGPGFRDDDLPRVFTPFFSRRPGGFGLGLAISERIVSEHRGTLTAANHPDGGGVVTISLPVSPAVPDRVSEGASSDNETPPARRRRLRHSSGGSNVSRELRLHG